MAFSCILFDRRTCWSSRKPSCKRRDFAARLAWFSIVKSCRWLVNRQRWKRQMDASQPPFPLLLPHYFMLPFVLPFRTNHRPIAARETDECFSPTPASLPIWHPIRHHLPTVKSHLNISQLLISNLSTTGNEPRPPPCNLMRHRKLAFKKKEKKKMKSQTR